MLDRTRSSGTGTRRKQRQEERSKRLPRMVVSKATARFVTEIANARTYKRVWDSFGPPSVWSTDAFVSDEAMSTKGATRVGWTGALVGLRSTAVIDAAGLLYCMLLLARQQELGNADQH